MPLGSRKGKQREFEDQSISRFYQPTLLDPVAWTKYFGHFIFSTAALDQTRPRSLSRISSVLSSSCSVGGKQLVHCNVIPQSDQPTSSQIHCRDVFQLSGNKQQSFHKYFHFGVPSIILCKKPNPQGFCDSKGGGQSPVWGSKAVGRAVRPGVIHLGPEEPAVEKPTAPSVLHSHNSSSPATHTTLLLNKFKLLHLFERTNSKSQQ